MVNIVENNFSKNYQKNKNKKQIILTHTSRNITDYINSVLYRNNGEYDKVPNFVISRQGEIHRLLPDNAYSNFFKKSDINKNSIIISLENLGWLEKIPIESGFVNWIGDIYNGDIYEKKWRDYFYWQPYTEAQTNSCISLIRELTNNLNINQKFIGHNTKVEYAEKYEGIITYSNFNMEATCLSPAFDFKFLKNQLEK